MFCTNCGCEVNEKATFCTNCGTRLKPKESDVQPTVQAAEQIASVIASDPTPKMPEPQPFQPTIEAPAVSENKPEEPFVIVEEPIAAEPPMVETAPETFAPSAIASEEPVVSAIPEVPVAPEAPIPVVAQPEKTIPAAVPPVAPAQPVSPVRPAYAPIPTAVQMPVKPPVQPTTMQVPPAPAEKPVSTWLYVLMLFLTCIPVVGLIVHIICLATAKQKSFRNYCRAIVILGVIALVLAIAALIAGFIFLDQINEFLSAYNIQIESLI